MGVYSTLYVTRSMAKDMVERLFRDATDEQLENTLQALIGEEYLHNFTVCDDDATNTLQIAEDEKRLLHIVELREHGLAEDGDGHRRRR